MKQSPSQYRASLRYRRARSAQIVLTMKKEDKAAWDAYAQSIGSPTATMIRRAVAASMASDGWAVPDASGPVGQGKHGNAPAEKVSPPPEARQLRIIAPATARNEPEEVAPGRNRGGRPVGSKDKRPRGSHTAGGEQTSLE